jgi:hypothetical protein
MVSTHCDGPACDVTVASDSPFPEPPDEWYSLTPPNASFDPAARLDFCSVVCLNGWASFAKMAAAEL